jgi:hypothetical protein
MKRLMVLLVLIIGLFATGATVSAQDEGCDTDSIGQALADVTAQLAAVRNDLEQENRFLALVDLDGAEAVLKDINTRCFGNIPVEDTTETGGDAEWARIDGDYLTLLAPANWANLADSSSFIDLSLDAFSELNPQAGSFIEIYRAQLDSGMVDILLLDMEKSSSLVVSSQNIGYTIQPSFLESMLKVQLESLGYTIKSTEIVTLPAGEALKLEVTLDFSQMGAGISLSMEQVMYVIISDEVMHTIVLSAQSQHLDEMTPIFDEIIQSVKLR